MVIKRESPTSLTSEQETIIAGEATKTQKSRNKNVVLGCSPRIYPRPEYPPASSVLFKAVLRGLTTVIFGNIGVYFMFPLYKFLATKGTESALLSDATIFMIGTSVVHTTMYLLVNGFFLTCDSFGWMQHLKLHRKANEVPTKGLIRKCLRAAVIGQLVTSPMLTYLIYPYINRHLGMATFEEPLPSLYLICRSFLSGHYFNEIFFYLSHRALHSKLLYTRFHKQHHNFNGTISIASEYADPVEVLFANLLPTLGGVLLVGSHPLVVWVWIMLRLQSTYVAHSGYILKDTILGYTGLDHSDYVIHHDHHHTTNIGNFGAEYLDWIFGTMDHFLAAGGQQSYLEGKRKNAYAPG